MNVLSKNKIDLSDVSTFDLQQNLNILIILVIVLVVIGSLISTCILKILLDGIDKKLFRLEDYCKFIVDGDINIEIPEYKGTQDIK